MNQSIIPGINSNMAAVAHNITRLDIIHAYRIADASKRARGVRQADSERCIYAHDKTGAVRTICQAAAAIHIGISNKLAGIIHDCLSV